MVLLFFTVAVPLIFTIKYVIGSTNRMNFSSHLINSICAFRSHISLAWSNDECCALRWNSANFLKSFSRRCGKSASLYLYCAVVFLVTLWSDVVSLFGYQNHSGITWGRRFGYLCFEKADEHFWNLSRSLEPNIGSLKPASGLVKRSFTRAWHGSMKWLKFNSNRMSYLIGHLNDPLLLLLYQIGFSN